MSFQHCSFFVSHSSTLGLPVNPEVLITASTGCLIKKLYNLGRKKRKELGLKGREWALSDEAGFTSKHQAKRVIEAFDELFDTWKPKEKYEIVNASEYKGRLLNHELIY